MPVNAIDASTDAQRHLSLCFSWGLRVSRPQRKMFRVRPFAVDVSAVFIPSLPRLCSACVLCLVMFVVSM